jgi:hypothetical protein
LVSIDRYDWAHSQTLIAREISMVGAVGLLSVMVGAVVAYASERFPAHVEALETGAGFLLISGLALTGYTLPAII